MDRPGTQTKLNDKHKHIQLGNTWIILGDARCFGIQKWEHHDPHVSLIMHFQKVKSGKRQEKCIKLRNRKYEKSSVYIT